MCFAVATLTLKLFIETKSPNLKNRKELRNEHEKTS